MRRLSYIINKMPNDNGENQKNFKLSNKKIRFSMLIMLTPL